MLMGKQKEYVCFICKNKTQDYTEYNKKKYCPKCFEIKQKQIQEQKEWEELYDYVFFDILGYKKGMKLTRNMILRLKGLKDGQFISSKTAKKQASYSYKIILYTFKAKKLEILRICDKIEFKDENHKINTIMKIIENGINDIVMRMEKKKEIDEKSEKLNISDLSSSNKYQKQNSNTDDKIGKMFKNLW